MRRWDYGASMNKEWKALGTRAVPRYTSYPTAPHFGPDVDAATVAGWLSDLQPQQPVSLYLHVPYCRTICHYCGCHTKASRRDGPLFAYAESLAREVDLVADSLPHKMPVSHVHWGGGTPSILPDEAFLSVVERLKARFSFLDDAEHAIELDPRTVCPPLVERLVKAGINRVSLGVQDFDRKVQDAIGRLQPIRVVRGAVELLRQAGITDINFDLMYGLPYQTAETIRETVSITTDMAPGRISVFGYAHVPWFKKNQQLITEDALPDTDMRFTLEEVTRSELMAAGYEPIGLDHFAHPSDPMAIAHKDGILKRNFQGYTTDNAEALIALGASAISKLPQGYAQNAPDIGGYMRSIEAGTLPIIKGKAFSHDDRLRGALIERIMTDFEADVSSLCAAYDTPIADLEDSFRQLDELHRLGLFCWEGSVLKVKPEARRFVRLVASCFDAYLHQGAARHSVAV
ncbi:oxygen-independent coproporphyrinogen III oxidase [Coralliovum pocilloporae]|uniref:oxygen-independent coproporphyrinogen III oxidase n=1 Tax=Coralliovum pocilloporae TaxID=3066369 RepID=UPI00330733A2